MNDFSELEDKLKALRPTGASPELVARVEKAMADSAADITPDNIVRPDRFRVRWLAVGAGLAAAAVVLIFSRLSFQPIARPQNPIAAVSPAPAPVSANSGFIPTGATQVVYHTRDEGLHFSGNSEEPLRRRRSITQETLRWQNPTTGASLRVSYPSEQVELIPVSYQ
jgi:hypothetical protein